MGELWREIKEWKNLWQLSRFFSVLILGRVPSLFHTGTDFNFAWSVPKDCCCKINISVQGFDIACVSSPCGLLYYKNVERLTYTPIQLLEYQM